MHYMAAFLFSSSETHLQYTCQIFIFKANDKLEINLKISTQLEKKKKINQRYDIQCKKKQKNVD